MCICRLWEPLNDEPSEWHWDNHTSMQGTHTNGGTGMNRPSSSLDWGLHQSKKRSPCPCPQRVPLRQVPFKKGTEISASRNQRVLEPLHSHGSLLKGDGYETIASAIPHRGMKFEKIKLASTYVQESMNRITKSLFIDLQKVIPFGNNVLVCYHIGIYLSSLMKR